MELPEWYLFIMGLKLFMLSSNVSLVVLPLLLATVDASDSVLGDAEVGILLVYVMVGGNEILVFRLVSTAMLILVIGILPLEVSSVVSLSSLLVPDPEDSSVE